MTYIVFKLFRKGMTLGKSGGLEKPLDVELKHGKTLYYYYCYYRLV